MRREEVKKGTNKTEKNKIKKFVHIRNNSRF